ncbi:hypothetical protein D9T18_16800 [Pseudoalteromonas agarivorans]|uniref:Uncharacterized protein n=1 Tax=Pseudoalteromonas agarivorans TaxID=176102 RepID=A0AAD0U1S5_9GAMM|nr:hypothetical protein D9T18_16800 [Pseudoalteromonas agarivorans]
MVLNHFQGLNVSLSALKNSHLEQLNSEFFALLSTRLSILKIDYLIMRIGIKKPRCEPLKLNSKSLLDLS